MFIQAPGKNKYSDRSPVFYSIMHADRTCTASSEPGPGHLKEPYHLPGYTGHIPTLQYRHGASFGRTSRKVLEDPCVAQAPIPILIPPFEKMTSRSNCSSKANSSTNIGSHAKDQRRKRNCQERPKTSGAGSGTIRNSSMSLSRSNNNERPITSNCEGYGIQVYQLPYWPVEPSAAATTEGSSSKPTNHHIFDPEVEEMLRCIPPPLQYPNSPKNVTSGKECTKKDKTRKQSVISGAKSDSVSPSSCNDKKGISKDCKNNYSVTSDSVAAVETPVLTELGCSTFKFPCQQIPKTQDKDAQENCSNSLKFRNRSPYVNPSFSDDTDTQIFRPCEGLPPKYSGHIPGYKFRSDGQSFGKVSHETKEFMDEYNMFPIRTKSNNDACP